MCGLAAEARAQAPEMPWFVTVNFGAQPAQREVTGIQTIPIYGETARISSLVNIDNGAILEIGGGRRGLWRNLGAGLRFSTLFAGKEDGRIEASIPDPFFFNRPRPVTQTLSEPEHKENGTHLFAVWFQPITPWLEVGLSAGPSRIKVKQDLAGTATIPLGTQTLNVAKAAEDAAGWGYNVGIDATFVITRNIGAGLFARTATAEVDLPSAPELNVGGFQAGIGARFRF
jgi:hypothetical protein